LLDLDLVVQDSGFKPPISMSMMQKLMDKHGPVSTPLPAPKKIPKLTIKGHEVPDISSLYKEEPSQRHLMPGGEREALQRLKSNCSDKNFIANFQKPKTESTGQEGAPWEPSTTGLSPYFHFGCLSIRKAWHDFEKCSKGKKRLEAPNVPHWAVALSRNVLHSWRKRAQLRQGQREQHLQKNPLDEEQEDDQGLGRGQNGLPLYRRTHVPVGADRLDASPWPTCSGLLSDTWGFVAELDSWPRHF